MATTTIDEIAQIKKESMEAQHGTAGNQFVDELKSSTLFQFNWGELLSAAPTALSLMGSCWVAASAPIADQISMTKAVPIGGFKYIVNQNSPTLRSILVIGKDHSPNSWFSKQLTLSSLQQWRQRCIYDSWKKHGRPTNSSS
jgi:hypothetical protein